MAVSGIEQVHQILFNRLPFLSRQKLDEISEANWLCNSEDLWKTINKQPYYDLRKGMVESIDWYKENKWL